MARKFQGTEDTSNNPPPRLMSPLTLRPFLSRYFGVAKDLPGVRDLIEVRREYHPFPDFPP